MNGIPSGLIEIFVCFLETPATQEHRYSVHSHLEVIWMDYTRSHAIESVLSFPVLNLAND